MIDGAKLGRLYQTKRPKHTVIEGKGITVEIGLNPKRTGWLITATSHRGDPLHEVEAVAAAVRMLQKLGAIVTDEKAESDDPKGSTRGQAPEAAHDGGTDEAQSERE